MGVSIVMGVPLDRWMVFVLGKIPSLEMDDILGGYPHDELETPKKNRCLMGISPQRGLTVVTFPRTIFRDATKTTSRHDIQSVLSHPGEIPNE